MKLFQKLKMLLFFALVSLGSKVAMGEKKLHQDLNWKGFFASLFAKHLKINYREGKGLPSYNEKLKESLYFSPIPFPENFKSIMEESSTSVEVNHKREEHLSNTKILLSLESLSSDFFFFNHKGQKELFGEKSKKAFELFNSKINYEPQNYFQSERGAFISEYFKDTVFITISGFGSHTIKQKAFYSIFEDLKKFGNAPPLHFFHPHQELGNTLGNHEKGAKNLISYTNKTLSQFTDGNEKSKIIFLGYSKGATVAMEALRIGDTNFKNKVKAIFSMAGPMQGSLSAEMFRRRGKFVKELVAGKNLGHILKELLFSHDRSDEFLNAFDALTEYLPKDILYRILKQSMGKVFGANADDIDLKILIASIKEAVSGFYEMSSMARLIWNLKYFNKNTLGEIVTIFNMSILNNGKDFLVRDPIGPDGPVDPPEIIPQLDLQTSSLPLPINWSKFGLDQFILRLGSLDSFRYAPGGLMDTQVAWAESKSIVFDDGPLRNSFSQKDLKELWLNRDEKLKRAMENAGIESLSQFINGPRNKFFNQKDRAVESIDLGEFRGSHWSTSFKHVLFPPKFLYKKSPYVHKFPQLSMVRALLETYALFSILKEEIHGKD